MSTARLAVDVQQLSCWLLPHFCRDEPLDRRVCARVLDLSEAVTLALYGSDRRDQLDEADRALAVLRAHLRLAYELGRLTDSQVLHVHGQADGIGRQLGGWMRSLDGDSAVGRRR